MITTNNITELAYFHKHRDSLNTPNDHTRCVCVCVCVGGGGGGVSITYEIRNSKYAATTQLHQIINGSMRQSS